MGLSVSPDRAVNVVPVLEHPGFLDPRRRLFVRASRQVGTITRATSRLETRTLGLPVFQPSEDEVSENKRSNRSASGRRSPVGGSVTCLALALGPPSPGDLDARTFSIGSDDYLVLSLSASMSRSGPEAAGRLTQAERDIVRQIIEGHSNSSIARSRGTSPRTIANQITAIYRKLCVRSRRELAASLGDAQIGLR